jgi:hypothetical protein
MGLKERRAQTRSPAWWWPPKIVAAGGLPGLTLLSPNGDNGFPDRIIWLLVATMLLAVLASLLPIEWGHGLHLLEDTASPAASRAQLRGSRVWRRSATIGWMLLTLVTLVLAIPLVVWDWGR